MSVKFDHFSEVHLQYDHASGCVFVIALNTKDGTRCSGGTRMKAYKSIDAGIIEAIALTRTMTKKCIIIGEKYNGGFSGGKGVIIGNPSTQKSESMLRRYGEFVNQLQGKFVTGTDLDISDDDAKCMAEISPYIDGLSVGSAGSTADGTAHGIIFSIEEALKLYGVGKALSQLTVGVQGLGGVGMELARLLTAQGVKVVAADICPEKVAYARSQFGATIVDADEIYEIECDVFSPNAAGGVITKEIVSRLRARFIIGSANNPLSEIKGGETVANRTLEEQICLLADDSESMALVREMEAKGTIYLPDYVVNIGGVYTSICEQRGENFEYMRSTLKTIIASSLSAIHRVAVCEGVPLFLAAEQYVTRG